MTPLAQSTLHQKLMGNKANTYYSDLKVMPPAVALLFSWMTQAQQAATIDKGRTSLVAKK